MANFYQFWFRLCQKNNALLKDESSEVIYVPTEANLPILEAGQR